MIKILDKYIIKTFFGPFFFIFSVLFFILIVNIVWVQMSHFLGKGLTYFEIGKLLFYFGVSVINLVMPLSILLTSIMTFGTFGERYELAAMKAAGISLFRVMKPLFGVSIVMSFILFIFANNVIPSSQKKARNMLFNITQTRLALNFTPEQFIDQIPGFSVRFDEISGENGEHLKGIYIHKKASAYDNQQTIIAKKGLLKAEPLNKNYLKLTLYDGYVHEENLGNKNYQERLKQPDQSMKFDTLSQLFDISEIVNKALEQERITDDPRFKNFVELGEEITKAEKQNTEQFKRLGEELAAQTTPFLYAMDKHKDRFKNPQPQFEFSKLKEKEQLKILTNAHRHIENQKMTLNNRNSEMATIYDDFGHLVMYQHRIIALSLTCVIFFMIGASLGSIIRKGGIGMPVVIAIIIFILFYVMNLTVENLSWDGTLSPYWASWIPNMILTPFAIWLTRSALTDSQLFDIEKYKTFFKPLIRKFVKNKEHARYR
ncbi:LptF/LptG family permease [Bergeyella zoohelcum]|uniref:YjgP/YjgQ family permease n=1 Tax=Bergeyella zoohelcum ATCC 43767 TaxID=883096 RepID=K1LJB8_9FLAO|nr:LptF/LptG family permease [Bergeyella zoohelcum]EKB56805.1 hypothetical protein HMPREF9699_01208 [Bergeyella zoohelcum ATCC 43767]SUV48612.1 lipopolysaccharide ABC transporter permease [Bergeyella zoohelcum]